MRTSKSMLRHLPVMLLAVGVFSGCESTDSGGSTASGGVYYGVGLYDPWYYGGYDNDPDIIVRPPGRGSERPIAPPATERPLPPARPEQPIARPPPAAASRPTPQPSIPSTPRPMPRPAARR